MYYPYTFESVIGNASGIIDGDNSSFTVQNFIEAYPQFSGLVPETMLDTFVAMANVQVKERRWHQSWFLAMCLFVAHFSILYLQSLGSANATASQVVQSGRPQGLPSSKSVGDVSVSYDFSTANKGIERWGGWQLTVYGQQFAQMAKLLGKSGMYVH